MLCVVCCLVLVAWSADYCVVLAVCCLRVFVGCWTMRIGYNMLIGVRVLFVRVCRVCCLLFACCLLVGVCVLLVAACCVLAVAWYMLLGVCCMVCVVCCMLCVVRVVRWL